MDLKYNKQYSGYYPFTFLLAFTIVITTSLLFWESSSSWSHFVLASLSWFLLFFLMPLWVAGYVIFYLRKKGISYTVVEFFLIWSVFLLGAVVKEKVDGFYGLSHPSSLLKIISLTFSWSVIFYAMERVYYTGKLLISSKVKTIKAEAEAKRYQLNPHMLFNSLNTISSLIYTDPKKADSVLHQLADLLRYSLDVSSHKFVPLSIEIDVVKKYFEIEQARFEDKLKIDFSIDDECYNILIPPLIIQSLVENSIKHNSISNSLLIHVVVYSKAGRAIIEVADDGVGFGAQLQGEKRFMGTGLENIESQVTLLKNANIEFSNYSDEMGYGASVVISFAI
ncbi:sensor histidine kinase [Lacimicrobium alkaliphilum]|uniref:Signal transduction histidine kinase internal region domain-containing protein n=1 Tax=Lacimicrobium alkaliphilum TaxID=1526571 RepID=A0ABQ1RMJ8_9ALTE|nr:histidine kinase [Lacimicrobium alkaliphilum]GGD73268.1 hypothetical protein GCM10011357_30440 [Lacimicrobium alkaliphilum]